MNTEKSNTTGAPIGRPMSKIAWPLAALALALCSAFFVSGCGKANVRGIEPPEAVLTNFSIESGPDEIGWARLWVIRHKQSGERFIFTERSSGGIFLTPLVTR